MRKIFDILEKLVPGDKLAHFFYFTLLAFFSTFLYFQIEFLPKLIIIVPCLIIAVAKEFYDLFVKRTIFDIVDFLFSVLSSIILYFLL